MARVRPVRLRDLRERAGPWRTPGSGRRTTTVAGEKAAKKPSAKKTSRLLLGLLFFVSGAVGLAYEVAWTRG